MYLNVIYAVVLFIVGLWLLNVARKTWARPIETMTWFQDVAATACACVGILSLIASIGEWMRMLLPVLGMCAWVTYRKIVPHRVNEES
jgi:uncharacterized membrane protein